MIDNFTIKFSDNYKQKLLSDLRSYIISFVLLFILLLRKFQSKSNNWLFMVESFLILIIIIKIISLILSMLNAKQNSYITIKENMIMINNSIFRKNNIIFLKHIKNYKIAEDCFKIYTETKLEVGISFKKISENDIQILKSFLSQYPSIIEDKKMDSNF